MFSVLCREVGNKRSDLAVSVAIQAVLQRTCKHFAYNSLFCLSWLTAPCTGSLLPAASTAAVSIPRRRHKKPQISVVGSWGSLPSLWQGG